VIQYSKRPFADADEMDAALIANWNRRVQPNDTVFHIGDVSFRNATDTGRVLDQLYGVKYLILGNHDRVIRDNKSLLGRFAEVYDYGTEIKYEGMLFVLCHYPMITWRNAHHGSFMLHGHCHGSLRYPNPGRIMDVGVDPQNYAPISIDEVVERLSAAKFSAVDHHLIAD